MTVLGSGQELGLSSGVAAEPVAGIWAGVALELGLNLGSAGAADLLPEWCLCPSPAHRDGDDALVVFGHDFVHDGTSMGSSLGTPVGTAALQQCDPLLSGETTEERGSSSGRSF